MTTLSTNDLNLLSAFLDGELDAPASLEIETRIWRDPEFAQEYRSMLALSRGISAKLRMDSSSERLRNRLEGFAEAPSRAVDRPMVARLTRNQMGSRTGNWAGLALAAGLSAIVASGATYGLLEVPRDDPTTTALVAAHLRGLLAQRPIDIESSDRHTVKPWFNERLNFSPIVPEEAIPEFELLGGRMELVDGHPAATLVYRHKSHFISLTEARSDDRTVGALILSTQSGLTEMHWRKEGIAFHLVSDLPAAELMGFARHWQ